MSAKAAGKKSQTPFKIFLKSIGLYFLNFDKFALYMTFPVLGQAAGLGLILLTTFFYTSNLPRLMVLFPSLNNFNTLILLSVLITLPGLVLLIKAFWEYLVAYGAVNSMLDNMLKSGKVYDFRAHTELVKRRTPAFAGLWFVAGIFSIIALCPLCWIICAILAVYFVLIFQVFTFEPEQNPLGCAKRSLELIKGHFASTFLLLILAGVLTYIFIPQVCVKLFDIIGVNYFFAGLISPLSDIMPDLNFPWLSAAGDISLLLVQTWISSIFIQYTLPMRSVMWSLWYKELNKEKGPSEKLMEKSRKKYGKKKLDENILRRATEKD